MSVLLLDGIMMKSFNALAATMTYLVGTTPTPVAFGNEGVAFKPPDTGPWMYATALPVSNDEKLQTVDKFVRILQIDCNDEMNIGTGRLKTIADKVLAYYWPRRLFNNTANTQKFRVRSTADSPVRIYGGYQSIAVSITFDGSVDRPFS